MLCVQVDPSGYVVNSGIPVEDCSGYLLMAVSEMDTMTYWADLAQALSPTEPALYVLMAAMLTAHAIFWGLRAVRKQLRQ